MDLRRSWTGVEYNDRMEIKRSAFVNRENQNLLISRSATGIDFHINNIRFPNSKYVKPAERENSCNLRRKSVILHVYDLSTFISRTFGPLFVAKHLKHIWHTGVVVFDHEYFYQGGICVCVKGNAWPGKKRLVKSINIGYTEKSLFEIETFLLDICNDFRQENYDLFHNNCNTFSNVLVGWLCGSAVPQDILDLPSQLLTSPTVRWLKPWLQSLQVKDAEDDQGVYFYGGALPSIYHSLNKNKKIKNKKKYNSDSLKMFSELVNPPSESVNPSSESVNPPSESVNSMRKLTNNKLSLPISENVSRIRSCPVVTSSKIDKSVKTVNSSNIDDVIDDIINYKNTFNKDFGSVKPIRDSVNSMRQSVNPMRDSVNPMRQSVNPMRESVNYMRESVNPMRESVNYVRESVNPMSESSSGSNNYVSGIVKPASVRRASFMNSTNETADSKNETANSKIPAIVSLFMDVFNRPRDTSEKSKIIKEKEQRVDSENHQTKYPIVESINQSQYSIESVNQMRQRNLQLVHKMRERHIDSVNRKQRPSSESMSRNTSKIIKQNSESVNWNKQNSESVNWNKPNEYVVSTVKTASKMTVSTVSPSTVSRPLFSLAQKIKQSP
eukprot:GHVL01021478.1.p1 GENE.GHVL01021478.1~~GHVL01021478.1.p1  ORF type:complete len:611 (+),score=117.09 GHVL01021478.1:104-1936(+)